MVFYWSLSVSKPPQVSKTLLSILADLNTAVVRTVSNCPVISTSSSPCTNPLGTVPRALITIGIAVTFMLHSFFNSLAIRILSNLVCGPPEQQSPQFCKFSFFVLVVDYYKIWSFGRDLVIHLHLKIPEDFVRIILRDRFWVVDIPFVRMIVLLL